MKFLYFFYFCGSFFILLDQGPDPDSEYGSTDLIESGSTTLTATDLVTYHSTVQALPIEKVTDSDET
jgi:hypothetical protein